MLHDEQYLYPKGPPMGISCGGNGALTGLETAGIIPGSIMAVTHSVIILKLASTTLAQRTDSVCSVKRASGCSSSITLNFGITITK